VLPLLLAAHFLSGAPSAAGEFPNVVMIISDDQMWGDYSFMGHPTIQTPHLDKLAAESLVFTRGYVPSSLCRPSLATLITGLYPHQHKITSNDPPLPSKEPAAGSEDPTAVFQRNRRDMIACIDQVPTLPRLLAERGYVSHQSGKWWEGNYSRGGFTGGMTHGDPLRGGRHGDAGLAIGREGLKPVLQFIDDAGKQPLFIWYAPFLPHQPHTPPDRLLDKYRDKTDSIHVARYWAMCEWFDETCGELLGYLDTKGIADNTLVVYVADNGWIQKPDEPRFAAKSKTSPYDGGTRTPIMLRWPGHVAPQRVDDLAISIDFAPTILAACGMQRTSEMTGINLLDEQSRKGREAIFGEIFLHNARDVHNPAANLMYRWCIDGWWKLILPTKGTLPDAQLELYDLNADPHETKNLAGEYPERVKKMRRMIDQWWPAAE
jgi:uncharacterized sulfatase